MGEVSGTDDRDAFELCPFPDAFRGHVLACCTRMMRVDVKIGDETHRLDYIIIQGTEKQDFSSNSNNDWLGPRFLGADTLLLIHRDREVRLRLYEFTPPLYRRHREMA
jgi:hypothetical protein